MTIQMLPMRRTPTPQERVDLGITMMISLLRLHRLVIPRLTPVHHPREYRLVDQVWMRMERFPILLQVDLGVVHLALEDMNPQHLPARAQHRLSAERCSMRIRMLLFEQRLGPQRELGVVRPLVMRAIKGIDRMKEIRAEEWAGILLGFSLAFASDFRLSIDDWMSRCRDN